MADKDKKQLAKREAVSKIFFAGGNPDEVHGIFFLACFPQQQHISRKKERKTYRTYRGEAIPLWRFGPELFKDPSSYPKKNVECENEKPGFDAFLQQT